MSDSKFDQGPEDIEAKNINNGSSEKDEKLSEQKFTAEFFNSVREEKARKLFPERGGVPYKPSWFRIFAWGEGREKLRKTQCEQRVYNCLKNSTVVRIMMGALKSSGCEIDVRRHISCEVCDYSVSGGYDPFLNQVVVCQNTCKSKGCTESTLAHEMIHMYDFCRRKLDLNNIHHLACTEIRAANLTHCSFISALVGGAASPMTFKQQHQECVKKRAVASVVSVKNVSNEEAWQAVQSVFDKCYNDLEPIGRRIRRNSNNIEKAYMNRMEF